MRALLFRLEWDELLHRQLEKIRLVFMPIVNPGGMWAHKRANPNGVDLMRNAPQRSEGRVPFLAGGQTLSPWLPWYCGRPGAAMEIESAAMLKVVREQLASRPFSLALDCHSGYGFADSIWFAYANARRMMPNLPEMFALKTMLLIQPNEVLIFSFGQSLLKTNRQRQTQRPSSGRTVKEIQTSPGRSNRDALHNSGMAVLVRIGMGYKQFFLPIALLLVRKKTP